jgi:hypothetical protein
MVIIAALSTDIGSSSHTTDPVIRVVHRLLFPTRRPTPAEFALLSVVLRKSAHVFEYAALVYCTGSTFTYGGALSVWIRGQRP